MTATAPRRVMLVGMTDNDDTLERLSDAARALHGDGEDGVNAVAVQATRAVPSATWAGLIEVAGGRLVPRATTGEPPRLLDDLQQGLGEGPCFEAAREQRVVTIDDVSADGRWPRLSEVAQEVGVCSMLCVPLWVDSRRLGTLSLYAQKAHAFDDADRRLAAFYATLAALALADGQRLAQLTQALQNRDLIGQAKGMLAERLHITPEAAFDMLSTISQRTNRKLVVVAREVVESGELPAAT